MRNLVFIASLTLIVTLIAGCQADMSPNPGLGDPYPAPINDPQITVHDGDLRPWLGFHPAVVVHDPNRPMHVEVPVRNLSNRQYIIQYRIVFYDDRGLQRTPVMGWERIAMEPKQTVRLTRKAMDEQAVSYRVEVRWAR